MANMYKNGFAGVMKRDTRGERQLFAYFGGLHYVLDE